MGDKKSTDPPRKPSPQRKATPTAREMIDEERRLREEKTERLRKAREAREPRKPRS
jgi:hypothetical protein